VLVRAAGVSLIGLAAFFTINLFGNLLAVRISGAEPVFIHNMVLIVVPLAIGTYLIKDGDILFKLLDS
jgi:hypothetical protein